MTRSLPCSGPVCDSLHKRQRYSQHIFGECLGSASACIVHICTRAPKRSWSDSNVSSEISPQFPPACAYFSFDLLRKAGRPGDSFEGSTLLAHSTSAACAIRALIIASCASRLNAKRCGDCFRGRPAVSGINRKMVIFRVLRVRFLTSLEKLQCCRPCVSGLEE